jgi:hypothetical protein
LQHLGWQRGQHIAERKRVWESLYPQTKHGGNPGKAGGGKKKRTTAKDAKMTSFETLESNTPASQPTCSFVQETAIRTQQSKTRIHRSARIGEKICRPAQALLMDTPIEDHQAELLRIAAIKDQDTQVAIAQCIRKHLDHADTNSKDISMSTEHSGRKEKHGTSSTYAMRRLARDRPDLHAQCLAGEMTPNAAYHLPPGAPSCIIHVTVTWR